MGDAPPMIPESSGPGPRKPLTFLDVLLACAVASAIILIPVFAVLMAIAQRIDFSWASLSTVTIGLLLLEPVAIFGGVYFVLIMARRFTWAELGLRAMAPYWIGPAVLTALGCLVFAGAVSQVMEQTGGQPMLDEYVAALAPDGVTWQRAAALILIVGGLVPLAEELLFRGVLYAWLRQRWGVPLSTCVSAALFALAHANLRMAAQIFVTGIALAVLYERSRSIFVSTLAHGTVNTISLVIIFYYAGFVPPGP
jgi:membrane protease YdiL (CAAX protease family)